MVTDQGSQLIQTIKSSQLLKDTGVFIRGYILSLSTAMLVLGMRGPWASTPVTLTTAFPPAPVKDGEGVQEY